MKKFIIAIFLGISLIGSFNYYTANTAYAVSDSEIEKILKAKDIVRSMVNYPDTLVFHNLYTKVNGNTVTLKFTAKNAFGVAETHVMDINVN